MFPLYHLKRGAGGPAVRTRSHPRERAPVTRPSGTIMNETTPSPDLPQRDTARRCATLESGRRCVLPSGHDCPHVYAPVPPPRRDEPPGPPGSREIT
ncbi:hypothetical protein MPTA5024_39045 [Microbispora sp. ATCC PTA-5024]|nr:hypothetical protein MPTA5024_39045 [Microbispora sp. ATCC PTA-5024]